MEVSSKDSKNFKNFILFVRSSSKAWKLLHQDLWIQRIQRKFIQNILLNLRVVLESSSKASKNSRDSNPLKFYWIQALKFQITSTTNLQRQIMLKQAYIQRFIAIMLQRHLNLFFNQSRGHFVFESKLHRHYPWIEDFSKETKSVDYFVGIKSK